ncbi:hypothetical protein D9Q98_005753 [Chlorella vulgaris]|uniref:Vacuolar ATPase assembly protein VMA22 n=1 Tax=Chlorella vulgaris TaxID=3077 RepID=A0A9D4YW94_CHLVU|nr:hypothetical protein D9Q98_005753 [Chlorella vulgaris]
MPSPTDREKLFSDTLDAAEDYLQLQHALGESLRAGFLSLAQARYAMGADRVSSLQIPSTLSATARVTTAAGGNLDLLLQEPSPAGAPAPSHSPPSPHAQDVPAASTSIPEAAAGALQDCAGPPAALAVEASGSAEPASHGLEQQLQQLRLAAESHHQSDNLMEQLAAKYCCDGAGTLPSPDDPLSGGAAADDEQYAEVAKPGKPLHWFGSLVAPSLRDAEGHFGRALAAAVQAANTQRKLRKGPASYSSAG